jgi:uncharacterized iron-regulated membrane protein
LVARDGVTVTSAAEATALVELWIETTRRTSKRTQVVRSMDDLKPLPPPDDATEAAARLAKLEQSRQNIAPPAAAPAPDGAWTVTLSLLDGQALLRFVATVAKTGELTAQSTPVVADLPLPYVH